MQLIGVLLRQNTLLTCFDRHVQHTKVIFRSLYAFDSDLLVFRRLLESQQIGVVSMTVSTILYSGTRLKHLLVWERIVATKRIQALLNFSSHRVKRHHRRVIGIFFNVFVVENFCIYSRKQVNLVIATVLSLNFGLIGFTGGQLRIVLRRRFFIRNNCSLLLVDFVFE